MTRLKTAILAAAALILPVAAQAAPLTVTLNGLEARGGTLYIGVQTEDQFMKNEGIAGEKFDAPASGSLTVTFDVPEGAYAVAGWHDFDGDGVFDLSESGMPQDGWSMINGGTHTGLPVFAEASVTVPAGGASIEETVFYPAE